MIERVGKEFPTLFICVRERVRPAPLEPKDGLVVGPAAASLRLQPACGCLPPCLAIEGLGH